MPSVGQKREAINQAVKVAKAFGSGGTTKVPAAIIETVYKKIVELLEDADS